jgi:hypothetical protein
MDNIKQDVVEIQWVGVDWIVPAQDKDKRRVLVNAVMNLRVPLNARKALSSAQFH